MRRLVVPIVVAAVFTLSLAPALATQVELPTIPDPVPVEVDAATTAFLVLDLIDPGCPRRPGCPESLPAVAALLGRAREAQVLVVYSTGRGPASIMPEVAAVGGEPIVRTGADKFSGTDLDEILRGAGIETLVMVGTAANGAVLYTPFGANARGYTVVVAEDGISADTHFEVFLTRYQLLNQPGFRNPDNRPLAPAAVTLSRTDLITFTRSE